MAKCLWFVFIIWEVPEDDSGRNILLKALETFGNCQRPELLLGVSQFIFSKNKYHPLGLQNMQH